MKKRTVVLINPPFQIRFIGWMLGIALGEIFIFYAAHLYFFKTYLEVGKKAGLPTNHVFFSFLSDQYHDMNGIFLFTAVFASIFLVAAGLLLSHRIAGPLYRLCKQLNSPITETNRELHFRPGDYFPELEQAYNTHIEIIQKTYGPKP